MRTLARHFGYTSISIVEAKFSASGRRLREHHIALMNIWFIAYQKVTTFKNTDLKHALQAKLNIISPGVVVNSAIVEWFLGTPVDTDDCPKSAAISFIFFLALAALLLALVVGITILYCVLRYQSSEFHRAFEEPNQAKKDTLQNACAHSKHEDNDKTKELDDIEIASVSTCPPASNDGTQSEENNSLPGSIDG